MLKTVSPISSSPPSSISPLNPSSQCPAPSISPLASSPPKPGRKNTDSLLGVVRSALEGVKINEQNIPRSLDDLDARAKVICYLEKAKTLEKEGKYEEALSTVQEGIDAVPSSRKLQASLYLQRAQCLTHLIRYSEAHAALDAAFRIGTVNSNLIGGLYHLRAQIYSYQSKLQEALSAIEQGLHAEPAANGVGRLRALQAAVLDRQGFFKEAYQAMQMGISAIPSDPNTLSELFYWGSLALWHQGLKEAALATVQAGIDIQVIDSDRMVQLLCAQATILLNDESAAQLKTISREAVHSPEVKGMLYQAESTIHLHQKEWRRVVNVAEAGLKEKVPPYLQVELCCHRAKALNQLKRFSEAFDMTEQGLGYAHECFTASLYFERSFALYGLKRFLEALEAIEKGLRHNPQHATFLDLNDIKTKAYPKVEQTVLLNLKSILREKRHSEVLTLVNVFLIYDLPDEMKTQLLFYKFLAYAGLCQRENIVATAQLLWTFLMETQNRVRFTYEERLTLYDTYLQALIEGEEFETALQLINADVLGIHHSQMRLIDPSEMALVRSIASKESQIQSACAKRSEWVAKKPLYLSP